MCMHKEIVPFMTEEIVGCLVTIFVLFYTNCGGLGGGGIMIPVAIFFYGFDVKSAIALSNATVAVASICRYIANLRKSHPLKDGKGILVDYTVAIIMFPAIVVGVIAGGVVNTIFPASILAIVFILLLVTLIVTTWVKLCGIMKDEREKFGPLCGKKVEEPAVEEVDQGAK